MKFFHPKLNLLALGLTLWALAPLGGSSARAEEEETPKLCEDNWESKLFRVKINKKEFEVGKATLTQSCFLNSESRISKDPLSELNTVPFEKGTPEGDRVRTNRRNIINNELGVCEASILTSNNFYLDIKNDLKNTCSGYKKFDKDMDACKEKTTGECYKNLVSKVTTSRDEFLKIEAKINRWTKEQTAFEKFLGVSQEKHSENARILWSLNDKQLLQPRNELIDASLDGSKKISTLRDYRLALDHPNFSEGVISSFPEGNISKELRWAKAYSSKFRVKMTEFKEKEVSVAIRNMSEFIAKAETVDGDDKGDLVKNTAENSKEILSGLTGGKQPPVPTPRGAPPVSTVGGPVSGSGLPTAALGAAALAAASGRSGGGTSSGPDLPSPSFDGPSKAKPTEGTKLAGDSPFKSDDKSSTKADKTEEKPVQDTKVVYAQGGSAPVVGSGSASIMKNGGKLRPNNGKSDRNPANNGVDDAKLGAFNGELKYAQKPKNAGSKAGTDVSDLLKQMQKLFNDPIGGAGAIPGGAFPGDQPGGTEEFAHQQQPGNGSENMNSPTEGGFDGYNSFEGSSSTASNELDGGNDPLTAEPVVKSSGAIGGKETSLFARVKKRHKICLEKGLVVFGVGGIPQ